MSELQTIAAVFDLLKVTWEVGKFLRRVRNADRIAQETHDRIKRLQSVLEGIQAILGIRDESDLPASSDAHDVVERIRESLISCKGPLTELSQKAGGSSSWERGEADNIARVKIAWKSSAISRLNSDLEARIHILGTDLTVLQLYEQTRMSANIVTSHDELLVILSRLGEQVAFGNGLVSQVMQRALNHGQPVSPAAEVDPGDCNADIDPSAEALSNLTNCIREAANVHERFTEQYSSRVHSDDRSERMRRAVVDGQSMSPREAATPSIQIATPGTSNPSVVDRNNEVGRDDVLPNDGVDDYDRAAWPLPILDLHIEAYMERARSERDAQHFGQAELHLARAIRKSQSREDRYGVPFSERVQMQEELAALYQCQKKFAQAVALVFSLLREPRQPGRIEVIATARQNCLLASIYHDRHVSNTGPSLSNSVDDIEQAEEHGLKAFAILWETARRPEQRDEEKALFSACVKLLIQILETGEKPVEAIQMRKLLDIGPSITNENLRRMSTGQSRQHAEIVLVDKHDVLLAALQSGDTEQVHSLLNADEIDVNQRCKDGKTILMHAIEQANEPVVSKLLDPEVGAQINAADRHGLTALHRAATLGSYEMVRILLEHDADAQIKDLKEETPVVKAVRAGHIATVEVFFNHDKLVLETRGSDEWTVVHFAVQGSDQAMVSLLLDLAPDLRDAVDRSGKTALHQAVERERFNMAMALLRHRHSCDVNATDSVSRTALYLAASRPSTPQRLRMVRLLLDSGARVDESKEPPRVRDYPDIRKPRRDSTVSRTSISTEGTVGTSSTSVSRFSRAIERLGGR